MAQLPRGLIGVAHGFAVHGLGGELGESQSRAPDRTISSGQADRPRRAAVLGDLASDPRVEILAHG